MAFIAHPKLSHLLSQWVSWAQGVWDVAVCWGRGKLCENCVGEAKKNITAWQHCSREWRTRRRSGGAREGNAGGGGGEGEWSAWVWQRGRWECMFACVHVCVGGGGGCWGNISGSVVRSYSSPCLLMLWVGLCGGAVLEEKEGMDGERKSTERGREVGGSRNGYGERWVEGVEGWAVQTVLSKAAPALRPWSGKTGSHELLCTSSLQSLPFSPRLSLALSHLLTN